MDASSTTPKGDETAHAVPELDPGAQLEGLLRRIAGLQEREMRRIILRDVLAALTPGALVGWLSALTARVGEGEPLARAVLVEVALSEALLGELPYAVRAAAYAAATERAEVGVARMLLSGADPHNLSPDEAFSGNDYVQLPLGVRRAAARTRDRLLLDRLIHDRDPRVITLLLDNPRIIERDVIHIAAMRPTSPDVLRAVAAHRRWGRNQRVRKALACNPYTPRVVALRLLPTLLVTELRVAATTSDSDPTVRREAERLLTLRRRGAPDRTPPSADPATAEEVDALIAAYVTEARDDDDGDPEGLLAVIEGDTVVRDTEEVAPVIEPALALEVDALMAQLMAQGPGDLRPVGEDEEDED